VVREGGQSGLGKEGGEGKETRRRREEEWDGMGFCPLTKIPVGAHACLTWQTYQLSTSVM